MEGFEQLPLTRAYLERVPMGLNSYPEATVKGSFFRGINEARPESLELDRLPPPLRRLIDEPPLPSEWIPEVNLVAMTLALRELCFENDAEYLDYAEATLSATLSGPLYRVLFAVVSPVRLAKGGSKRWNGIRRGTSREILELNENGNLGRIHYPAELFPPLFLGALLRGMEAVYRLSRAPDPKVELKEWGPRSCLVEVLYDQSKPRVAAS